MHGRILRRLTSTLGTAVLCAGSTLAWGQDGPVMFPPTHSAYASAADPGYEIPARTVPNVSAISYKPVPGLEGRVAELEAELKKIKNKEATAKKQAAGKPTVSVGGRIHWDTAAFNQDTDSYAQIGDQQDGNEFRRARIYLKGDAFHVIDYKMEFDFADTNKANQGTGASFKSDQTIQSTAFKDVYITVKELPLLGHVRVGHFKEPSGLEQLASGNYLTFMERSLIDEGAFAPGRNSGVMAFDTYDDQRGTWAIGAFTAEESAEPPVFKDDDGGVALTMRGTYLPWYDEATDGRGLFHAGISYSYRDMGDNTARFRQRPEAHLADYFVDTGNIADVPSWQLLGLESAFVYGPFSAQAEWFGAYVRRDVGNDLFFNGCYAYASYFLTGENRHYNRSGGVFDRVKPHENFFRVRAEDGCTYTGKGAWEVAYRYSYIDLTDSDIAGGRGSDHTLGLNWYLNPYTRLMFNYVNSTLSDGGREGNMSIFETRAQIDF